MFDSIYIYVPAMKQLVRISEGSGDNLTDEDLENGYVDYIYYEQYVKDPVVREIDGGMIMLAELFQEKFRRTADAIPYVLGMAYCDDTLDFIVLE